MLVLDREQKLKLKQEKHAREMQERCKRIHDVKWMHNGIDRTALEKQIQEKKERDENERKSNEAYEKNWLHALTKAKEFEEKEKDAKRRTEKEIMEYRQTHQSPHTRASYDLNDPFRTKKEKFPDRDDHHKVGASSLLRMDGHDLNAHNRARAQREQNRAWLEQQIFEKERLKEQRKCSEENYLRVIHSEQEIIRDKTRKEIEERQDIEREILEFNKKLAEEKYRQLQEEKSKLAEGDNFTMQSSSGPVLTEDRSMPGSSSVAYMYKGMTEEEKLEFRKGLEKQMEEDKKRKEHAYKSHIEWEKQYIQMYREGLLRTREEERRRRKIEKINIEENKKVAKEQNAMKKEREENLREGQISEEFYDQFEKSP